MTAPIRRTLIALTFALAAVSVQAQDLIRAQVSAPGSTAFIVTTHLASVLKQRHGYNLEVATGFPGVRSIINNARYETELSIYAPALAYFLNNKSAMFKNLEEHAALSARLRPLFTYEGDLFTMGTLDPSIKSVADIEGKRVYLGPKGAALVNINAGLIEAATGLKANEDYELVHVDWAGSAALLQDGAVDVLFQLCAPGCATWTEISAARKVYFVGYTNEMIAREAFQKALRFPGRTIKQIAVGTWGPNQGNDAPTQVVGEFTGILANDKMPDEIAYNITKAFWETKDDLSKIAPFAKGFDIRDASFGMINTIHPGAARYLKERGVALPQ